MSKFKINMSKEKADATEATEAPVTPQEHTQTLTAELTKPRKPIAVDLPYEALGTYKRRSDGEWMVAVVAYDPTTGQAQVKEVIPSGGPTKDFAVEKFKLEAITREIVG